MIKEGKSRCWGGNWVEIGAQKWGMSTQAVMIIIVKNLHHDTSNAYCQKSGVLGIILHASYSEEEEER